MTKTERTIIVNYLTNNFYNTHTIKLKTTTSEYFNVYSLSFTSFIMTSKNWILDHNVWSECDVEMKRSEEVNCKLA